ncbi:hypothetical protein [uncultured Psychroserpens sp.]|uniref:hypothetical protein n=1 Tax=uncultured Psychroserpens sp. TaxID=255436 RepID=UPI002604CD1D|nr:hypothetical protein [uncultured Psychroserpens sp.]
MKIEIIALLIGFVFSCSGSAQEVNFNIDQSSWEEDFVFLKKKVEKMVPQYKNDTNKKAFDNIYEIISSSEMGNQKEEVVFALQRLLNTLNDEGCNVPLFQKGVDLKILPIKTYWFNDGLYILDASNGYKEIIDKQIVKINNINIQDVFNTIKPVLNADNDYYKKYLFQAYGLIPSLLKTVDLGTSNDEVTLEFASGEIKTIESGSIESYSALSRGLANDEFFSASNTTHVKENYWFEYIPKTKTLFVQLQHISNNDSGDSFSDFVKSIETILAKNKTTKVIVDVRYGGGGNGFKLKPLTDALRDSKNINQRGRLFVLTSNATRGTLLELASILKQNTKAVIVGEPTAEGANTVGDIKYITLPNSGLKVSLTHKLWPTSWNENSSTVLLPDEKVVYNYTDRRKHKDPWLFLVDNYTVTKEQNAISDDLKSKLIGTYKIEDRKVSIVENNGRLFLTMKRRMKSFFEISTELYFLSEGTLSTDINDVFLKYNMEDSNQLKLTALKWKDLNLKVQ